MQACPLTLVQVPAPRVPLHLEPLAQLDVAQQTPSTQLPLVHSFAAVHAVPLDFLPGQTPPLQ